MFIPTKEKYQELIRPEVDKLKGYSQDVEIGEDYIAVLSEDIAIHVFKINSWMMDSEGKKLYKETGIGTIVYVLRKDAWKMLHIHQSYEKIDL